MISSSRKPEVAEPLQVGVVDRGRVVDDPLGEIHHGQVDLVQPGRAPVGRDLEHRLAELLDQHLAVGEASSSSTAAAGRRRASPARSGADPCSP